MFLRWSEDREVVGEGVVVTGRCALGSAMSKGRLLAVSSWGVGTGWQWLCGSELSVAMLMGI